MHPIRTNHLAVWVAAILYFVLGAFWFDPHLFGARWLALLGKTPEQMKTTATSAVPLLTAFIAAVLASYAISCVTQLAGKQTAFGGITTAVLLWVGIMAPNWLVSHVFESRPAELFVIDATYPLAGMVMAGAIVGAWKKREKTSLASKAVA